MQIDLDQSERKSTQEVHARPGQTTSQVDPSSQLGSTCESVWPGLKTNRERDVFVHSGKDNCDV